MFSNHMSLPDVKTFNMSENSGDVWLSWTGETFARRKKSYKERNRERKDKLLIDKTDERLQEKAYQFIYGLDRLCVRLLRARMWMLCSS